MDDPSRKRMTPLRAVAFGALVLTILVCCALGYELVLK